MNKSGILIVAGLLVGAASLISYAFVFALAPVVPILIAGATAISPKSRSFAWGALAAAAGGFLFLIIAGVMQSSTPPGVDYTPPQQVGPVTTTTR